MTKVNGRRKMTERQRGRRYDDRKGKDDDRKGKDDDRKSQGTKEEAGVQMASRRK